MLNFIILQTLNLPEIKFFKDVDPSSPTFKLGLFLGLIWAVITEWERFQDRKKERKKEEDENGDEDES
jgi:hypothetical protein